MKVRAFSETILFMKWNHWALTVIGVWLIVSPWVLGFYELNLAVWSAIVSGFAVALLGFWSALPED